ncbi:MAG: hypothetical protein ABIG71_01410 [Candidatus Uhrbacteria bacterium]
MFLTVHGAVGALIGFNSHSGFLAFVLGIVSHFILDAIPHGDDAIGAHWKANRRIATLAFIASVDGFVMVVLLTATSGMEWLMQSTMLLGVAGAVLPDVLQGLAKCFPKAPVLRQCEIVHDGVHHCVIRRRLPMVPGMLVQVAVALMAYTLLSLR